MNGTDLPRNSLLRLSFLPILAICAAMLGGCAFLQEGLGESFPGVIVEVDTSPEMDSSSTVAANNQPVQEGGGMAPVNAPTFDAEGNVVEAAPRTDYPDKATSRPGGYEPPNDASAHAYLTAARVRLPTYKYLGTETGGTINLDNGYRLRDDERSLGGGIGGSIGIGTYAGQKFRFNLNIGRAQVDVAGPRGGFDPGPGTFLLIPGTGDGPFGAGFALAPGAPGVNAVTASDYSLDYKQTSFTGKVSADYWRGNKDEGGFGFSPYLGFSYARTSFDQSFGGAIPGFGVDFQYDTSVKNNSWGVVFGGQAMKPIRNSPVMLRAGATGQADFNRAKGTDSLDFTGFGSQTMAIKNSDTTFSYSANAGVTVGAEAPIRFDLDLFGGRVGNTPSISRDGVGPSRLEFENSNFYGTALRTTFRF